MNVCIVTSYMWTEIFCGFSHWENEILWKYPVSLMLKVYQHKVKQQHNIFSLHVDLLLFTRCYVGRLNKRWAHMFWDFVFVVYVFFCCSFQCRKWCQSFGFNTHRGKSDRLNDSLVWWIGTFAPRPQPYIKYI